MKFDLRLNEGKGRGFQNFPRRMLEIPREKVNGYSTIPPKTKKLGEAAKTASSEEEHSKGRRTQKIQPGPARSSGSVEMETKTEDPTTS